MHIENVIFLILSKNAYTKFSEGPYFETYEELVAAVEQFIYYYNHQRRQHKLNCLPPATYRSLLEAA